MKHFNLASLESEEDIVNKESDSTSTTQREKEYVVYFRLLNFKQLENAVSGEKQLQWELKIPKTEDNAGEGKLRVRETISLDGKKTYDLTIKNHGKENSKIESTLPCGEEVFVQMSFLADQGMHKHRYVFPIEGSDLKWEIDVYPDGNGGYKPWGRAELEIKEELSELPPLPIEVEETILPNEAATEEGNAKVRDLFDKFFLIKNKYNVKNTFNEEEGSDDLETENEESESDNLEDDTGSSDDTSTGDTPESDEDRGESESGESGESEPESDESESESTSSEEENV